MRGHIRHWHVCGQASADLCAPDLLHNGLLCSPPARRFSSYLWLRSQWRQQLFRPGAASSCPRDFFNYDAVVIWGLPDFGGSINSPDMHGIRQVHTWVCQSVCSSALQWIHCYMGSAGWRRGQLRSAICVCHFLVAVAINVATAAAAGLDIFTNLDIWYRQTGLRHSLLWCKNLRREAGRNGNLVVEIVGRSSQFLRCTVRCSCPACSENLMLFNYSVV